MELPEISKENAVKYGVIGIALVVLAVVALWGLQIMSGEFLSAHFIRNPIPAGDTAVLEITVTNNTNKDLGNIVVHLEALDNAHLRISEDSENISVLGKSEQRTLDIPIVVDSNTLKGVYAVDITVSTAKKTLAKKRITLAVTERQQPE